VKSVIKREYLAQDEQWSFVEKKSNQRWLWHAVDHATNIVIVYVFGKRKDNVFKETSIIAIVQHKSDRWAGVIFARVSLYILSVFA
jgi:hypothetical protein